MKEELKIKCPNCGLDFNIPISKDELSKRYTPYPVYCSDPEIRKGCLCWFECYVYDGDIKIRKCV
jgi:hypothetical protein